MLIMELLAPHYKVFLHWKLSINLAAMFFCFRFSVLRDVTFSDGQAYWRPGWWIVLQCMSSWKNSSLRQHCHHHHRRYRRYHRYHRYHRRVYGRRPGSTSRVMVDWPLRTSSPNQRRSVQANRSPLLQRPPPPHRSRQSWLHKKKIKPNYPTACLTKSTYFPIYFNTSKGTQPCLGLLEKVLLEKAFFLRKRGWSAQRHQILMRYL